MYKTTVVTLATLKGTNKKRSYWCDKISIDKLQDNQIDMMVNANELHIEMMKRGMTVEQSYVFPNENGKTAGPIPWPVPDPAPIPFPPVPPPNPN